MKLSSLNFLRITLILAFLSKSNKNGQLKWDTSIDRGRGDFITLMEIRSGISFCPLHT